jgi:maltose O-acetyltransferase
MWTRAKLLGCERVGRGARVLGRVWVHGGGTVDLGDDVLIDARDAPVELHAHPGARIRIGDRVRIGPGASVEALGLVTVGDGADLGAFCKILDSQFHAARGDRRRVVPPVAVTIGAGAVIGERAIVLPGAHVVPGERIAPHALVSRRGPPPAPVPWSPPPPPRGGPLAALAYRAGLGVQLARAWWLFGSAAFGRRVFAAGPVKVANEGALVLGDRVQFLGGMIATEVICRRGARLEIGDGAMFNYGAVVEASELVRLGRRCLVASAVRISDRDGDRRAPILVGDDVWIAHGATLRPGVTVGDRAVVGAGAVVMRDVPPDALALGDPARALPLDLLKARG